VPFHSRPAVQAHKTPLGRQVAESFEEESKTVACDNFLSLFNRLIADAKTFPTALTRRMVCPLQAKLRQKLDLLPFSLDKPQMALSQAEGENGGLGARILF